MTKSEFGRLSALCLMTGASLVVSAPTFAAAAGQSAGRHIEDVVVTAERKESTVQDTAISITAFSSKFIEDFGLRNQEDLANYTPATTIQPYDISIRGVGRLFRTLGGDPGVSTYLNGVYSEDFGIASTEGGLFDIERVEVLRGPQGTLYGRNAVGGSVNFINKKPGPTFGAEARVIAGNYGLFELYGTINQPIIQDVLSARITGSKRTRDGYITDTSPFGKDINNYGDENYSLALRFTPLDNLTFNARGNERSYRRRFNGGSGTSPIVTSQNGVKSRDTTHLAFGYGQIRKGAGGCAAQTLVAGEVCFADGANSRIAQYVRPGVDSNGTLTSEKEPPPGVKSNPAAGIFVNGSSVANATIPNYAFGVTNSKLLSQPQDIKNLDKKSLKVATNGLYDEAFDHQAGAYDATWVLNDKVTLKYIGGYTDYFYDRTTEEDKTANPAIGTYNFYVLQENENYQHEIQVFWDPTENLSITSGAFLYHNHIDQRLDLYDNIDVQGRYTKNASYGPVPFVAFTGFGARSITNADGTPKHIDIKFAKRLHRSGQLPLAAADGTASFFSQWTGDTGDALRSGDKTPGTFFAWDNTTDTEAKSIYSQAEWNITDKFALTLGARYGRDNKTGEENIITVLEIPGFAAFYGGLKNYNISTGALNADGSTKPILKADGTPNAPVRFNGVPFTFDSYLPVKKNWDKITGRINLDWTPNEQTLMYVSATTGWRSGGFNLGFRSTNNPIFRPENVYSYEVGYKGQLFDNSLQINLSAYFYNYNDIQQIISVIGRFGTGTAVDNAPQAQTLGFEGDVLWLPTENLTIGGNWSYTHAQFTKDFFLVENNNPLRPPSVFTPEERTVNVKNNELSLIPKYKVSAFADFSYPIGDWGKLDLLTSLSFTAKYQFNINNNGLDEAPELLRWDARLAWTSPDAKISATLAVQNITDDIGARDQQQLGEKEGNFLRAITPNDPRTYYLEVRYKIGDI